MRKESWGRKVKFILPFPTKKKVISKRCSDVASPVPTSVSRHSLDGGSIARVPGGEAGNTCDCTPSGPGIRPR